MPSNSRFFGCWKTSRCLELETCCCCTTRGDGSAAIVSALLRIRLLCKCPRPPVGCKSFPCGLVTIPDNSLETLGSLEGVEAVFIVGLEPSEYARGELVSPKLLKNNSWSYVNQVLIKYPRQTGKLNLYAKKSLEALDRNSQNCLKCMNELLEEGMPADQLNNVHCNYAQLIIYQ